MPVKNAYVAMAMMTLVGALSGYFVVPMNALLQHRGHVLMGAGHSIAVQNFNENIGILLMVGLYATMIRMEISVNVAIVMFGLFVSGTMASDEDPSPCTWPSVHGEYRFPSAAQDGYQVSANR